MGLEGAVGLVRVISIYLGSVIRTPHVVD